MEKKIFGTIPSLLLFMALISACSLPGNATPTATIPVVEEPQVTQPADPSDATPAAAEGLCTNAYFPVREGATWSYESTGSPAGDYSYTDTVTSVRADGFTLNSQIEDVTRTQEWSCKPEGLVALQLGGPSAATLNTQNMQLNLSVNNVSGVTFPSEITTGKEWQHMLEFEGAVDIGGTSAEATGAAESNFTALGTESVTVPAGTFDAMKIQVDSTITINASFQGVSMPVTFTAKYIFWFAQGVGSVKAEGTGEIAGTSFSETIELQSYNIP